MATIVRTTQNATSSSSITSLVVTKPTGLAVGDIMIAIVNCAIVSGSIDTPSGWTVVGTQSTYGTERKAVVLKKVADSSDVAASNFTFTFSTSNRTAIILTAFANVNTTQDGTNQGTTANGSASSSGFTPTTDDLYVMLVAGAGSGSCTGTTVAGYAIATDNPTWTELADVSSGSSSAVGVAISYADRTAKTATGTVSATITPNAENIIASFILLVAFQSTTLVSPSVINSTGTVNAPTITGGATVSPSTINATSEVKTPTDAGQADWSAQDKSDNVTWTPQAKS